MSTRAIGITKFLEKKFNTFPFEGKYFDSFGEPEKNFRMMIYGHSGHGKTEMAMQLSKYLAQFTKVYYNSYEQGVSKTLQDCLLRNNMEEVSGRVMFGDQHNFEQMIEYLKRRNSPKVVIIDSRDYINLTTAQWKRLIKLFPRKAFIILCWESAGKPKSQYAKDIEFTCDIKVRVFNFKAYIRCRFGGNQPFIIWDRKPKSGEQLKLGQDG